MEKQNLSSENPLQRDTYMDMVPYIMKYLKLRYKLGVGGTENIPDGPAMFVANHLRVDDSLLVAAMYATETKKPLRLGAKNEYFEGLGINNKGRFGKTIQKFVTNTQQIPVYREDHARGVVKLEKDIKHRFSMGESVLLHAEGTRSLSGKLNKFQIGAARFAIRNNVPLVPVSVTYDKQRISPRKFAYVRFGEPLLPQAYGMDLHHYALIPDGIVSAVEPRMMNQSKRIEAVTDIIEQRVAALSGQERSGYRLDPYTKQLIIPDDEALQQ